MLFVYTPVMTPPIKANPSDEARAAACMAALPLKTNRIQNQPKYKLNILEILNVPINLHIFPLAASSGLSCSYSYSYIIFRRLLYCLCLSRKKSLD